MLIKTLLVALVWMFSCKIGFARTILFARFARTLPGSIQTARFAKCSNRRRQNKRWSGDLIVPVFARPVQCPPHTLTSFLGILKYRITTPTHNQQQIKRFLAYWVQETMCGHCWTTQQVGDSLQLR
jgi:hypothetical protein